MDQFSNSATRQLLNLGGSFRRWTRASIAALVADLAGRSGSAAKIRTLILAGEDRTEIYGQSRNGTRDLRTAIASTPETIVTDLRSTLKGRAARNVLLRIDSARAVIKNLVLPATARDVIPAIVRNKVESLAPWPLPEVMWGYRVADRLQPGNIAVEVAIVSRKTVESLLSAVGSAGARVAHLDIAGSANEKAGIGIDFRGPWRARKVKWMISGVMSLAALAALLAASYGTYLAVQAQRQNTAAISQIAELKSILVNGKSAGAISAKLVEANKLYLRKKDNVPVVTIVNGLTSAIPDGTWLDALDFDNDRLTIAGRSMDVSSVIESLERSELFTNVNFASATQRDAKAQNNIFSISAAIEKKADTQ